MNSIPSWVLPLCMGIGLSASAGFRVFVPLLVAGIGGYLGWVPLTEDFRWLAGWPALICFGTATVVEIFAYYLPVVDNFLDALTTPLSILAGTLLVTSVLQVEPQLWKWAAGLMVGGGSAFAIQSGTTFLRLFSTKTTAGMGNAWFSTGENLVAWIISSLSILVPIVVAVVMILLILFILTRFARAINS